jgi:hypothetical protein
MGLFAQVSEQVNAYLQVFAQARSVAEIGFNGGHSMLAMLTANPAMEVVSFDLGVHDYSKPSSEILKRMFESTGARIEVEWGSSTDTVPAFHAKHPGKKYDVVIVDGAHTTEMCMKDTVNMKALAKPGSMLIIDDTPCKPGYCVDECVEKLTKAGVIKLLKAYPLGDRAFSLFRYINVDAPVPITLLSSGQGKEGGKSGTTTPQQQSADHHHGDVTVEPPAAGSKNESLRAQYDHNRAELEGALAAKGFTTTEGHSGQVLANTHTYSLHTQSLSAHACVWAMCCCEIDSLV